MDSEPEGQSDLQHVHQPSQRLIPGSHARFPLCHGKWNHPQAGASRERSPAWKGGAGDFKPQWTKTQSVQRSPLYVHGCVCGGVRLGPCDGEVRGTYGPGGGGGFPIPGGNSGKYGAAQGLCLLFQQKTVPGDGPGGICDRFGSVSSPWGSMAGPGRRFFG